MSRSAEGSVFKSNDGRRWVARLRYTDGAGNYREKKRVCLTHKAALAKIRELQDEISIEKADRKTYRQLDRFFRDQYVHPARYVSGQKISGYRQKIVGLNKYLDSARVYFGERYLDEISYGDLREYKEHIVSRPTIHGRQRSVSDTNHFLKALRRVLNVGIEQGWLATNPFKRGQSLITSSFEVERTRVLSVEEECRLLEACTGKRAHIKPLLIFAIETACRKNEILCLRWANVNMDGRFIRVEAMTSKTLKPRLVPISSRLQETLARLWRNSPKRESTLVFTTGDCKHAFLNALAAASLDDVHFHDLRHTAITRMLERGISPPLVMKISGHSQMKTFLRYVNQSESSILEIAKRLDAAA